MMTLDTALHLPSEIVIAGAASERVGEVAAKLGMRRPVVVTDPCLAERDPVQRTLELLERVHLAPRVYADVRPDPTTGNVEDALAIVTEHGGDGVIAVGGGSSLDTGKAVAVMATNGGSVGDYAGYHRIPNEGLPLIGVPTTAGTGSEVTRVAVITDTERSVKMMILDDHLLCSAALVDFELTVTCPPALTAHVGIDSLTHAIEAYVSRKANPVTDLWALRAASLIAGSLRRAFEQPDDREARAALALGATLAGMAFSNASVALVHGMSRPIGAHFHLPHGLSNALLLPAVTRFSLPGAPERYATVARQMRVAGQDDSDRVACQRLVDALRRLNEDLGVGKLRELGAERERFDAVKREMADAALASGSPAFNPRVPDADEIVRLYEEVF
jgi:alcohol dehydrogenase class IV